MKRAPRVHVGYRLPKEVVEAVKAEAEATQQSHTEVVEKWLADAARRAGHKATPLAS